MLDPEIKQKWIEELESGKYQQTRCGRLYFNGKYCVLGVLGKVLGKDDDYLENPDSYDFIRDAGFSGQLSQLYLKNDISGWTFPELAKWIAERKDI